MPELDFTYDSKFDLILQGFDVSISPSSYGSQYVLVTLDEGNNTVFERDIPLSSSEGAESTQELIENTAQAAIDIFEAERGTLGQGAGAEVMATKKKSFATYEMKEHEEWFLTFKGTEFEDLAYGLLESLYDLDIESNAIDDTSSALYSEMGDIEHKLKVLNLNRMKSIPAGAQVIIIQASKYKKKAWFSEATETKNFLDAFTDTEWETEVLNLVSRYLDLKEEVNQRGQAFSELSDRKNEIWTQMENLSMEALQKNIVEKLPVEGIGAFPGMAQDLAELMEGISIDEPLDEMPPFTMDPFDPIRASKKAEVIERGKGHLGIDPAEVEKEKLLSFEIGDKVELSSDLESFNKGGVPFTVEKGTKGCVRTVFDGHGDCFMVHFEDGSFLKVPTDKLKKAS